ncbi:E3 ubiquitin-protein ligase RNF135 isoform X2 [Callithrix jacchus]|uniref:E3 ubiquitin-protein ligase RNF135 isoform X2 n=1 Tax=Callithrix jacchus TaxID=9483 RepID=UPI0004F097F2|nr:E3 ubiquitin-protein ligase RNF135 isoform X2 [Callithrix jacchus]
MGAHPAKGNLGDICGFLAAGGKWVSEGRGPPPKVSSAIRAGLWRIKVRFQQDRRKETGWPQGRRVEVQKSITEVGQELTELGERLVDIVRSLQSQRPLSESGPDNELSILGKLVTSDAAAGKIKDILHDLEEIQEKLRENFSWKEAPEAPTQREHLEAQSSSSCPMSDQSPALRRASHFAQWAINPTFNLKSLSCSLEVSRDFHTVTVSPRPQPYRGSCERFSTSQVLCSQALSSGKHYWEVDTRNCSHWAVGVASWEMSRDQVLGRTTDSCCVEWKGTNQLSAWHMVKETVLGSDRPGVVGIWLNLEEGKLAFYSVDNQEKLLYECTISASSPLHPAFWLYGLHPGNYLIIKQVKV